VASQGDGPGPSWGSQAEARLDVSIRDAPKVCNPGGPENQHIRQDPRIAEAGDYLRWAIWCGESLHHLRDVIDAEDPAGSLVTPHGHRATAAYLGHVIWGAVTAVGALDRAAAAFGWLLLPPLKNGWVYDFRALSAKRLQLRPPVQAWVDAVKADPLHADFLGLLRDPLVHRTLKRRVTFGVPPGQVFPDTPSDDRTMLMLAGDFEGPASDIQVVRPGGEPVPMQQVHAPDELLMHDQSGTGPDSVRTLSARELVDSAITATQRHVQEAIAVFESGAAWPAGIDLCADCRRTALQQATSLPYDPEGLPNP